ncbi:MAG: hypothetical protein KA149_10495 [Chitinophagales bacterium]|nr:hypothetical protein [Chitinophagales bacterium]
MKKLRLLALAALSAGLTSQAQITVPVAGGVPQAYPYSSQVRGTDGNLLANQFISLRISLRQGGIDGPVRYAEQDTITTSPNGIFSVVVGGGRVIEGNFDSVDWSGGMIYQKVELDDQGGTNFTDMGTAQLLSLPYALSAGNGVTSVKYDSTGKMSLATADGRTEIKTAAASWMTTGNIGAGTTGFIGTTDNSDLTFKRFNQEGIRIRTGNAVTMPGRLGLGGVTAPATTLDVNGGMSLRDTTVNVSGNFTLNVGNRGLIFINSSVYSSQARVTLSDGLVKGQIVILAITSSNSSYGVRFYNSGSGYNTRVNTNGGGVNDSNVGDYISYKEGNTITLLWNGTDWVQIASSMGGY